MHMGGRESLQLMDLLIPEINFLPEARLVSDNGGATVLLEGIGQVVVPQHYVERAKQVAS